MHPFPAGKVSRFLLPLTNLTIPKRFAFASQAAEGFERCRKHHKRYPPEESNPQKTLRTPTLLNVFHAHMQPITALQFVTKHQLIITGARDCSVGEIMPNRSAPIPD